MRDEVEEVVPANNERRGGKLQLGVGCPEGFHCDSEEFHSSLLSRPLHVLF